MDLRGKLTLLERHRVGRGRDVDITKGSVWKSSWIKALLTGVVISASGAFGLIVSILSTWLFITAKS